MSNKTLKRQFDSLLSFDSNEERLEQEAGLLAMQFLSRVDREMARRGMSKKELAGKVHTSPAFITQLFRGDRKPSWTMLAKMKEALDIDFVVLTKEEEDRALSHQLLEYHRRWTKSRYRLQNTIDDADPTSLLEIVDDDNKDFALAG